MAKSKTTKDEQKVLELEYKTELLPSAQHKTGLAGWSFWCGPWRREEWRPSRR